MDENGWQQDFWLRFPRKDNAGYNLVIVCCGFTQEISLRKEY